MGEKLDDIPPELLGLSEEDVKRLEGGKDKEDREGGERAEEARPEPVSAEEITESIFERAAEQAAEKYGIDVEMAKEILNEILSEDDTLRREIDEAVKSIEILHRLGKGEISRHMADLTASKLIQAIGDKALQRLSREPDEYREIKKLMIMKSLLKDDDGGKIVAEMMRAMAAHQAEMMKAILSAIASSSKKDDDKLLALLVQMSQQSQQSMMQFLSTLMTAMQKQTSDMIAALEKMRAETDRRILELVIGKSKDSESIAKEMASRIERLGETMARVVTDVANVVRTMEERHRRELEDRDRRLMQIIERMQHETHSRLESMIKEIVREKEKNLEERMRAELEMQKRLMELQQKHQEQLMNMMLDKLRTERDYELKLKEIEYRYATQMSGQNLSAALIRDAVNELREVSRDIRSTLREYMELQMKLQQLGFIPHVSREEKRSIIERMRSVVEGRGAQPIVVQPQPASQAARQEGGGEQKRQVMVEPVLEFEKPIIAGDRVEKKGSGPKG